MPVVGACHWEVGLYGKRDPALSYERQQARTVFQQVGTEQLLPSGSLRRDLKDNVRWLQGRDLEPCDAGWYSIAVDASGNASPCLSLLAAGNLLNDSPGEILARFDRNRIMRCSNKSSCNRLDRRIVGSVPRYPLTAARTPVSL